MVEGVPPIQYKQDYDVKDERTLNGVGSKDLELGHLGTQKEGYKIQVVPEKSNEKADFEKAIELTRYDIKGVPDRTPDLLKKIIHLFRLNEIFIPK